MAYVKTDVDLAAALGGPDGIPLMPGGTLFGGGGPGQVHGGQLPCKEMPRKEREVLADALWEQERGGLRVNVGADPAVLAAVAADAADMAREAQNAFRTAEKREPWIMPEGFRGGKYPDAVLDPASILRHEHSHWQYAQALSLLRNLNRPIYLFGAMTADKECQARFTYWQRELMAAGFRVLSPARQPQGFSNAFYMHQAINDIDQCDVLLAVPSPYLSESKGIWVEIAYAEYTSKYVLWNGEALLALNRS